MARRARTRAGTGGFLLDMAVHDYDAACWLLGQRAGRGRRRAPGARLPGARRRSATSTTRVVTIRFAGGGVAATHVSRTCAFGHDIRCEVVGSEGSVLVGNAASAAGVRVVTARDARAFPQDYRERFADAYRAELAAFVAACRGDGPRGPGLEDDRRAVEIGIAARASAVAGEPLAVGDDWPWP